MDGTVLIADDDRTIRTVLAQALTRAGCKVHATASMTTLLRWVGEGLGDLVISDVVMPDGNGLDAMPRIAAARPDLPVIVISAQNTIMTAIRAEERGVFDYLPKPFDLPDLLDRARRALSRPGRTAKPAPAGTPQDDLPLIGRTPAMQALYRAVARVLNADLPVLILGESGTGKTLIARALHDFSDRRGAAFTVAEAADLGDDAVAAALRARVCRGDGDRVGTLLLEEVGDFDAAAQARLVRLLDAMPADGARVVATAQADPGAALDAGGFRRDLYYRLSGIVLKVPPLASRVDDIALLAQHFLSRGESAGLAARWLAPAATEALRRFAWPGNVRQLETVMRRLLVTGAEPQISGTEVTGLLGEEPAAPGAATGRDREERLSGSVAQHLRRYFALHGDSLPPPGLYMRIMREVEVPLIEIALAATGGNQAKCAELLGINRNTLRKKILDHDIQVTRGRKLM